MFNVLPIYGISLLYCTGSIFVTYSYLFQLPILMLSSLISLFIICRGKYFQYITFSVPRHVTYQHLKGCRQEVLSTA